MLGYIYVESSDYGTYDLGVSGEMKRHLKRVFKATALSFGDLVAQPPGIGAPDDHWFTLQWMPYNGYSGKYYRVEEFVDWVSEFCESGQLFQQTIEDGGGLWGWHFDEGKYQALDLVSKGRWHKPGSRRRRGD